MDVFLIIALWLGTPQDPVEFKVKMESSKECHKILIQAYESKIRETGRITLWCDDRVERLRK